MSEMEALSRLLRCLKLQTLEEEEDHDQLYFPTEITDNILPSLPVKSILRFRSVSKSWLSRISDPSFKLINATTAFFIPAVDRHTGKLFFLSDTGTGSLTHLMTLDRGKYTMVTEAEHAGGLVFLTTEGDSYEAIVVNPSTRKIFTLPYRWRKIFKLPYRSELAKYFFGFDESTDEHKIFRMFSVGTPSMIELMEVSLSDHKWREIDASFDTGQENLCSSDISSSVCVNSVMHWLLLRTFEILAFDLRTDTFSVVKLPLDGTHYDLTRRYDGNNLALIKINGCVGVVFSHRVVKANEMHIWILQDRENHVWVKETVMIPESWDTSDCPMALDSIAIDEIIFSVESCL